MSEEQPFEAEILDACRWALTPDQIREASDLIERLRQLTAQLLAIQGRMQTRSLVVIDPLTAANLADDATSMVAVAESLRRLKNRLHALHPDFPGLE